MPDEMVPSERLTEYVTPLSTTDPAANLDDLQPLADGLDDARVVGMGEATHGTREFFQLKHRVLRLLVEEHGFRLFGIEANFSETLALNDYVLHGDGDPEEGLDGIYFWTWNTEEVLAMIEWLREFNEDRPLDDRVRFYGYDAQFGQGPARALREFLADPDPAFLDDVAADLDALADEGMLQDQRDVDTEDLEFAERVVEDLGTWFEDHDDAAVDADATAVPAALARRHYRTLEQAVERQRAMHDGEGFADAAAVRDEHMAENVAWIREYEDADRIALWAHNGHVFRGETGEDGLVFEPMGSHLDDRFGDEYAVVGFDFEHGSFRAVAHPEHYDDPDVETWTVEPLRNDVLVSETGSPDADARDEERESDGSERPAVEFHEAVDELDADADALFVDVAAARDDDAVGPWLDRPHLCHGIGAMFHEGDHSEYCERYRLTSEVDVLLFVPETTAARAVGTDD